MTANTMESSQLTIGVVAEIHCTPPGEPNAVWHNELRFDLGLELLDAVLHRFREHDVDVIAVLGDLSNLADRESLGRVRQKLQATGKPIILLSGNHDVTDDPGSPSGFQHFFADAATCTPPLLTALSGRSVQLLGVERDAETNTLRSLGAPISSRIGSLEIIMSHYPLLPLAETLRLAGMKHAGDLTDLEQRTSELLALTKPAIVLHGHLHVRATTVAGQILHLSFAALVEPPHECSMLTISTLPGGQLRIARSASSVLATPELQLPVLSPSEEIWSFAGEAWHNEVEKDESPRSAE